MDFELGADQERFRDVVARLFADHGDFESRQHALRRDGGMRQRLWQALASEAGALAIGLPEAAGGYGGPLEQLVLMEEAGRALLSEPLAETLFQCAPLLAIGGGARAEDVLAQIPGGGVRLAMAHDEPGLGDEFAGIAMPASPVADGWVLQGQKRLVVTAPWASHIIVAARTSGKPGDADGLSLFLLDAAQAGIHLDPYAMLDERPAADIRFDSVPVGRESLIGEEGRGLPLLEAWRDRAIAAAAAEATGLLGLLLEDTVEHARARQQFGQPIGNFQAIQHRLVDMHLRVELVRSAALLASQSLDGPADARSRAASAAKVTMAEACRFIGQNAVQLHGAMGMTDELRIGHYFKRATVLEYGFGPARFHRRRHARLTA